MASGPFYAEGPYMGEVLKQALGVTGEKETPTFILSVQITDRLDRDDNPVQVDQYERTIYMHLTEGTREFTLERLKVLGFAKSSLKFLSPEVPGHVNFVGQSVRLWCKHETYQGKTREKWNISTPREDKPIVPIKSTELSKLDALFGKGLREISAQQPAPARETVPASAPVSNDVPF